MPGWWTRGVLRDFSWSRFIASAFIHGLWLASPVSRKFAVPLDGYRTFRGKRIFGDNKTWRGLFVMIPATGLMFYLFAQLVPHLPDWMAHGMWSLSPAQYGALGLWAGLACMAAELPNSFFKRQMDIAPGRGASGRLLGSVCFVVDHIDSVLGVLIALSMVVSVPWAAWAVLLVVGPAVHLVLSALLFVLKVKVRPV